MNYQSRCGQQYKHKENKREEGKGEDRQRETTGKHAGRQTHRDRER